MTHAQLSAIHTYKFCHWKFCFCGVAIFCKISSRRALFVCKKERVCLCADQTLRFFLWICNFTEQKRRQERSPRRRDNRQLQFSIPQIEICKCGGQKKHLKWRDTWIKIKHERAYRSQVGRLPLGMHPRSHPQIGRPPKKSHPRGPLSCIPDWICYSKNTQRRGWQHCIMAKGQRSRAAFHCAHIAKSIDYCVIRLFVMPPSNLNKDKSPFLESLVEI